MKTDTIASFEVKTFFTPLKRPFVTALGSKTATTNVGMTITLSSGAQGYGEASASLALSHLTPAHLFRVLNQLGRHAVGCDFRSIRKLVDYAWHKFEGASPAVAAFECALWQAWCAANNIKLSNWFGGALERAETDITISAWDEFTTRTAVSEAKREGFHTFKIKVGDGFKLDFARISAAHQAYPKAKFLIDGNQGLTSKDALRLLEASVNKDINILALEQPLPKGQWDEMAKLARRCPVMLIADESVMTPRDAYTAASLEAAGAISIKIAKSGILRSLEIAAVAKAAGLKLMISCMAETALGLSPSVHLALGTGMFDFVDLDSDHLLVSDGSRTDWVRRGPWISIS